VLGLDPVAAVTAGTRLRALLAENPPLQPRDLALNGAAIMRVLAIPPSRRVGEATRFLMERVLDEPSLNTEAALTGLLGEFAASHAEG
jgi:tRNA nucleotidyltransferase (CCA-adding enzyme)